MREALKSGLVTPSPMTFPLHYTSPNSALLMRKLTPREAQRGLSTSMSASEEEQAVSWFTIRPSHHSHLPTSLKPQQRQHRWKLVGETLAGMTALNYGSRCVQPEDSSETPPGSGRTLSGGAKRGGGVGQRVGGEGPLPASGRGRRRSRRRWPTFSAAQMPESLSIEAVSRPPPTWGRPGSSLQGALREPWVL